MITVNFGQWQAEMFRRLMALGHTGFIFDCGNWWPIDREQKIVAGPFATTAEFDAWLTDQENTWFQPERTQR